MSFRTAADLVDPQAVEALFGGMDPDTCNLLLDAAAADATEWTERLAQAWQDDDANEQSRARHSLKGICGNFGMTYLFDRCAGDLAAPAAVQDLRDCRDASLAALRAAVTRLQ
jgi:HPt (histidine-containing phosphotransfer) domain-containing protein